jgi:hypothetical protein
MYFPFTILIKKGKLCAKSDDYLIIARRLGIHVGCSIGVCSTIQIEQVLFDDPQKLGCSSRIKFDVEQQLSNKTLIEHNSCPILCSINVIFD